MSAVKTAKKLSFVPKIIIRQLCAVKTAKKLSFVTKIITYYSYFLGSSVPLPNCAETETKKIASSE